MSLKSEIYHKDYLFWIYPLIILALIVFAIRRDNSSRESGIFDSGDFGADTSITMVIQNRMVDYSKMTQYIDSNLIFSAIAKEN